MTILRRIYLVHEHICGSLSICGGLFEFLLLLALGRTISEIWGVTLQFRPCISKGEIFLPNRAPRPPRDPYMKMARLVEIFDDQPIWSAGERKR